MTDTPDFTSLTFTQQLHAVTDALDSNNEEKIRHFLELFLNLYDPSTKHEEIIKNEHVLRCGNLLERLLDKMHFAPPLVFLGYMRMIALVSRYEEDIHATDAVSTVLDVMQDNKDPEVQVAGLKFLANLTQDSTVRDSIASKCLEYVVFLMEHEEYSKNPRVLNLSCLLLANLAVESENKELIGVDAIPAIMTVLKNQWDTKTCIAALTAMKNLVTNSTLAIIEDLVQNGVISSLVNMIKQHDTEIKLVEMVFDSLKCIFHENGTNKSSVSSDDILVLVQTLSKYIENQHLILSGNIVLLQLAKLAQHRITIGNSSTFEFLFQIIAKYMDNVRIVNTTTKLIDRLCITIGNLSLIKCDLHIPIIFQILQTHKSQELIQIPTIKIIYRLLCHHITNAKETLKKNNAKSQLVTIIENTSGLTKRWAVKTKRALKSSSDSDSSDSDDLNFDDDGLSKRRAIKKELDLEDLAIDLEKSWRKRDKRKKRAFDFGDDDIDFDFSCIKKDDAELDFGDMIVTGDTGENDGPTAEEIMNLRMNAPIDIPKGKRESFWKRIPPPEKRTNPKLVSSLDDLEVTVNLEPTEKKVPTKRLSKVLGHVKSRPITQSITSKIILPSSIFSSLDPDRSGGGDLSKIERSPLASKPKANIFEDDLDFGDVLVKKTELKNKKLLNDNQKEIISDELDFGDLDSSLDMLKTEKDTKKEDIGKLSDELDFGEVDSFQDKNSKISKSNDPLKMLSDDLDFGDLDSTLPTRLSDSGDPLKLILSEDLELCSAPQINDQVKKNIFDDDLDFGDDLNGKAKKLTDSCDLDFSENEKVTKQSYQFSDDLDFGDMDTDSPRNSDIKQQDTKNKTYQFSDDLDFGDMETNKHHNNNEERSSKSLADDLFALLPDKKLEARTSELFRDVLDFEDLDPVKEDNITKITILEKLKTPRDTPELFSDDLDFGDLDAANRKSENKSKTNITVELSIDIETFKKSEVDSIELSQGDSSTDNKNSTQKQTQKSIFSDDDLFGDEEVKNKVPATKTKSLFDFDSDEDLDFGGTPSDNQIKETSSPKKTSYQFSDDLDIDFGDSPNQHKNSTSLYQFSDDIDFGDSSNVNGNHDKRSSYQFSDDIDFGDNNQSVNDNHNKDLDMVISNLTVNSNSKRNSQDNNNNNKPHADLIKTAAASRRRASESKVVSHEERRKIRDFKVVNEKSLSPEPTKVKNLLSDSDEVKKEIPTWQKQLLSSHTRRYSAGMKGLKSPPTQEFWKLKEKY